MFNTPPQAIRAYNLVQCNYVEKVASETNLVNTGNLNKNRVKGIIYITFSSDISASNEAFTIAFKSWKDFKVFWTNFYKFVEYISKNTRGNPIRFKSLKKGILPFIDEFNSTITWASKKIDVNDFGVTIKFRDELYKNAEDDKKKGNPNTDLLRFKTLLQVSKFATEFKKVIKVSK